jgi:hypothetical protein
MGLNSLLQYHVNQMQNQNEEMNAKSQIVQFMSNNKEYLFEYDTLCLLYDIGISLQEASFNSSDTINRINYWAEQFSISTPELSKFMSKLLHIENNEIQNLGTYTTYNDHCLNG